MSAWLKTYKFWLIAAAAVLVSILVLVFRKSLMQPGKRDGEDTGFLGLPPAPKAIQDMADRAYEDALVAKATAKANTEAQKARLTEASQITDKKQRRKAIADLMRS